MFFYMKNTVIQGISFLLNIHLKEYYISTLLRDLVVFAGRFPLKTIERQAVTVNIKNDLPFKIVYRSFICQKSQSLNPGFVYRKI